MPYQPIESAQDFRRLIKIGETAESLHLEFKREVKWKRTESPDPKELCRDVAQFANTEGGVVLIGIEEKSVNGRRVADGYRSVDDSDGLTHWIEDAVTNYLVPNTFAKTIVPIDLSEGRVLAVNIPPSIHLVALWDRHAKKSGIEYLRRTNRGKEWLNPDDVERHIMDGSRAAMLRMKQIVGEAGGERLLVSIVPPPGEWFNDFHPDHPEASRFLRDEDTAVQLISAGEDSFTLNVQGGLLTVPYAFLEAAWFMAEGHPALAITHQIVIDTRGVSRLERTPYPVE